MSIIAVLIPVTLVLVAVGIWAFFWAVRSGQFEELDVPGWEILLDERAVPGAGAPAAGISAVGVAAAAVPVEQPAAAAPGSAP